MNNITHKIKTHRIAIAQAIVRVGDVATMDAVRNQKVPKGNVLESARIAGLFGVKRTSDIIPDCHPLPVEFTQVRFNLDELEIQIEVEVHTIYRTGVEVEAMHGASVAALTIYDMLKPIDKDIEICSIRLLKKKGGKSQYNDRPDRDIKTAVVVCSDSISAGKKEDFAGKAILVVNVASRCGLTPQYEALEALQKKYGARGFTVLGVPSGQFMQELKNSDDIAEYCSATWGVTFPMTEKSPVNGRGRHPLYKELVKTKDSMGLAGPVMWNFEKFLILPDGKIHRFRPTTVPDAPEIVALIEANLAS